MAFKERDLLVAWELLLTGVLSAVAATPIPVYFYRKLRTYTAGLEQRLDEAESAFEQLKAVTSRVDSLELQLAEHQEQRKKQTDWLAEAESLNLNHRGQVIRLHKRGDSITDIAAALQMGQGEVLLITKIYELTHAGVKHEIGSK